MSELAQLLREAAEKVEESGWSILAGDLAQAAASLEAQEPVAWMRNFVTYAGVDGRTDGERICSERKVYDDDLPLYRHPPTSAVPDVMYLVQVQHEALKGVVGTTAAKDPTYSAVRVAHENAKAAIAKYNEIMGDKK